MVAVGEKTEDAFESSDVRNGRFTRHRLNVDIAFENSD